MNKIVLSLGLLLLVFSCGDNPCAPDNSWMDETYYPYPIDQDIDYDGALNDCDHAEYMDETDYKGGPENICCCNSEASNYSEDGWNCNPEDNTYCIFD